MSVKNFLRMVFGSHPNPNYQLIPFPAFAVPAAAMMASFGAYLFGSIRYEYEFRVTCLLTVALFVLVLVVHLVRREAAWLAVVLGTIALCFSIAWIWQKPDLLYLVILSTFLSVGISNVSAVLLVGALESLSVIAASQRFDLFSFPGLDQPVLQTVIWATALALGGGYFLVERALSFASQDYERMQVLLESSRLQQVKLAETLDDLAHANRQLSLLFEKNLALRKTAEEATEAKSTYIARVSHEIRTPMNMILGITDLIIENQEEYDEETPSDLMDDIRIIRRNCDHLLALVNDVLDLSRAETGHMVLKKEWISIIPEIDQSLEIVMPLAKKKHLQLLFDPPENLPQIYCDRTRIRQVVVNLLSNAVRYTEQGMVSVWVNADDHWLTVQVKDTGPGIQPADAERIFEPFVRGMSSTRQETNGSGLGLSVSRQLLEVHGGKIWMESQPGMGSSFAFKLPLNNPEPPRRSPSGFLSEQWVWVERKRRRPVGKTDKQKRVIVCEPEDFLVSKFTASQEEVEFVRCQSVPAMVEDANTTPAHLAVINAHSLQDLLVKMEQAARGIKDTPIIGCSFSPSRAKEIESGVLEYIQKPFSAHKLRTALQKVSPSPKKFLIVDDNFEVQQLIARIVTLHNDAAEILLAQSAAEALAILEEKQPDVILLDLALPDMNGWHLVMKLKKDPRHAQVPIIIISAHDLSDSPPNTRAMVITQNGGFPIEQFTAFTMASLAGATREEE